LRLFLSELQEHSLSGDALSVLFQRDYFVSLFFFNLTPQAVRSFSSLPILLSGKIKTGHKDQSKVQKMVWW